MSVIENLKYDNSAVSTLKWGNADVRKLVIPGGDYWEEGSSAPALEARLFGMGSNGRLFNNDNLATTSAYFYGSNAYSAIVHIYGNNTGGITTNPSVEAQNGINTGWRLSAIDDYAYMLMRTSGYNGWAGGSVQSGSATISFSTVNTPQITSSVKWMSTTDEDNQTLLTGMVCSKAVRVPAGGTSSYIGIMEFPYEFDSELYFTDIKMLPVTVNVSTHDASYPSEGLSQYSTSGMTASVAEDETSIDSRFTYNISKNTTSQYREYMFILCPIRRYGENFVSETSWGVTLHFVQEPFKKNRIYYGIGFGADTSGYPSFSDEYRNRTTVEEGNLYKHHTFFQTANSKVLIGNYTISARSNSYVAYPNSFDYNVDLSGVGSTILSSAYMWGEQEYTVVRITSAGNVVFNIKG